LIEQEIIRVNGLHVERPGDNPLPEWAAKMLIPESCPARPVG
jgi:hypothetical protein